MYRLRKWVCETPLKSPTAEHSESIVFICYQLRDISVTLYLFLFLFIEVAYHVLSVTCNIKNVNKVTLTKQQEPR